MLYSSQNVYSGTSNFGSSDILCQGISAVVQRVTESELCFLEVYDHVSKSSVLFDQALSPDSFTPPFALYQVRESDLVSCEAKWESDRKAFPLICQKISMVQGIPKAWTVLHSNFGVESVVVFPLHTLSTNPCRRQSLFWGSITVAHRSPCFFTDSKCHLLHQCLKDFISRAHVDVLEDLASAVCQLNRSSSVLEQAEIIQQLFHARKPVISASFAVFHDSLKQAALFVDSTRTDSLHQVKQETFHLMNNTVTWNLQYEETSNGIVLDLSSYQHGCDHADIALIKQYQDKSLHCLWVLPLRKKVTSRGSARIVRICTPIVLGLSGNVTAEANRWEGYLGALYLMGHNRDSFSTLDANLIVSMLKVLQCVLERKLNKTELKESIERTSAASTSRMTVGSVVKNLQDLELPGNLMEQMRAKKKESRERAPYYSNLHKLQIDSLIDDTAASSLVVHGKYDNIPCAVKVMMGIRCNHQRFRIGNELSIAREVSHSKIVSLLNFFEEVKGVDLLDKCCSKNSIEVERWFHKKWNTSPKNLTWYLLVMEYCDKGSLECMIHENKIFNQNQDNYVRNLVLSLLDISQAMEYLHKQGIVHGDLKPANVLIKSIDGDPREWSCCIADFGSSLRKGCNYAAPTVDHGCTYAYRAPEFMKGFDPGNLYEHVKGCRLDVYSFGIIVYEMMEGCIPFKGKDKSSIANIVRDKKQRPTLTKQDYFPLDILTLLKQCWAHIPEERPSFADISNRLKQIEGHADQSSEH